MYKKLDPLQKENYRPVSLTARIKDFGENHSQTNNELHDRETSSFYNWFQKITWDTKFFSSDVRKMEKGT